MSHSYVQDTVHVVFSTKGRAALIPRDFQGQLLAYFKGICQKLDISVEAIGGMTDHVHILMALPSTISLSKAILTIKANSSKWAKEKGYSFAWQVGYAAFSVSASNIPTVARYIENQEIHHRKRSFADEFVALLKKHGVAYDANHVLG